MVLLLDSVHADWRVYADKVIELEEKLGKLRWQVDYLWRLIDHDTALIDALCHDEW